VELICKGLFRILPESGYISQDDMLLNGKLEEYFERLVDKLPPALQTAGRYAIITKDTALFQGLSKSVEYGDFIAKAILYDHLTKAKGKSKADALGQVTEEFVNYDRLPGRDRGYLEGIGLLWFWSFKIRVLVANEVITNTVKHAWNGRRGWIVLQLRCSGTERVLSIADDGRGYDPIAPHSTGLRLLR